MGDKQLQRTVATSVNKEIILVGVTHVEATLSFVLNICKNLSISKDTTVFLEPQEKILNGEIKCVHNSMNEFFKKLHFYLNKKTDHIKSLNPEIMPSHTTKFLAEKCGAQYAEEEYMAQKIIQEKAKKVIVFIGANHIDRMHKLISEHNRKTKKVHAYNLNPEDIFITHYRKAVMDEQVLHIDSGWLHMLNEKARTLLKVSKNLHVQQACWNDEALFNRYIRIMEKLMIKYQPHKYVKNITAYEREKAFKAYIETKEILDTYTQNEIYRTTSNQKFINQVPSINFSSKV